MEQELVKIASDNPAHPKGYYIQFKDKMKAGDVIWTEKPAKKEKKAEPELETNLTVAQIKDALANKEIEIPPHVTLKANLQALLDEAE